MRHHAGCATGLAIVLAATSLSADRAAAETTISTEVKTPVLTGTAANGQPDSILINSSGSVVVTGGTAVTMNSNHNVTNQGKVTIRGMNNTTGILATPGTTGAIVNSGTITLDEDFTPADADKDGDNDGPFAQGSGRNGIWVAASATHNGAVTNSGTVTIEGNQSAGIRLDAGLNGALTHSGTINVLGDDSHGVKTGDVSGNVAVRGAINVQGKNAVGAAILGDVGGTLLIQNTVAATGYRATTAPADPSKLDADDLLQGGPAVKVAGNVAGGIVFDTRPADADTTKDDEDSDGIKDAEEGNAAITSFGSAAAVEIGAIDRATAIGAVTGNTSGHGLIVKGTVAGLGVYKGVDATAMTVGGLGGSVGIAKGMSVGGTITADSADSNATALRIGSGAIVNEIAVTGGIGATGASLDGKTARALVIDSGAQVATLTNSGTINAVARADKGSAIAIVDAAGTLSSVENKGKISATGAGAGKNVAIDLRQNSAGTTISQLAVSDTAAQPSIVGDIYTGAGNDLLKASAGTISGNVQLGAGNDAVQLSGKAAFAGNVAFGSGSSTLSLANTSSLSGDIDFAGGTGTMSLTDTARFSGQLLNSGNVAVNVGSGTLAVANKGTVALASLNAGAGSMIDVTIDRAAGTNTLYAVSGAATFAAGSQVRVKLAQVDGSQGSFTFVRAGTLTGVPVIASGSTLLPFMFKGTITANTAANEAVLTIANKSAAELGLNGSQGRAYAAILDALDNEAAVAQSFLAITEGDPFRSTLRQMLPDHAGGTFEAVTSGSRAAARILADPKGMFQTGAMAFWLQQVAWGGSKSLGSTSSYDVSGWGASGGAELRTGFGNVGLSLAYLHGTDADGGSDNNVASDQYEIGAHWRGAWGGLQAHVRGSVAEIGFKGRRRFVGNTGSADVVRVATGTWDGRLYSAGAGASYEFAFGRFSLRPVAGIHYYRLKEDGYAETGGGDAFNLTVRGRTSDELAASGSIAAGYDFGGTDPEAGWLRAEVEGGRRQIVGGSLGDTTASFKNGTPFTLVAEDRTNGWTGKLRLMGGSEAFRAGGEFSAEEQQDHVALAFRASISFPL